MKTRTLIYHRTFAFTYVLLTVLFSSCEPKEVIVEYKVVKDKKDRIETHYKHVYSFWEGDFVLQPDVQNEYYIIYEDGSYDQVELGEYSITEIGDTIVNKRMIY